MTTAYDFSAIDIIATLYFGVMNYDAKTPNMPERDRFIMSKGHATGALYTALCARRSTPGCSRCGRPIASAVWW